MPAVSVSEHVHKVWRSPMAKDDDVIPLEPDESLPLEDSSAAPAGTSRIQAFGRGAAAGAMRGGQTLTRAVNLTGAGATRCRLFHTKITVAAMEHMVSQINEWLDTNQFEVKHVDEVVGVLEGKTPEPNLIVTVWY
jgi:hypothetical protein